MSETIIFCACGDSDCPLRMNVTWAENGVILVVVQGEYGYQDRQVFTYAEFVDVLELLDNIPDGLHDDVYRYSLLTPLSGGLESFFIADRNYNFILQHTKDIISANTTL